MTLKDWLEIVHYKISETGEDISGHFPLNTHVFTSWNGQQAGYSSHITFNGETGQLYIIEVCDYAQNLAYRWIHPDYRETFVDDTEAWDDVRFIDVEVEDIQAKATAIFIRN